MCQLTAVIPQRELTDNEMALQKFLMTELLIENSLSANRDGCGLANEEWVWKSGNPADKATDSPEFEDAIDSMVGTPIIGHVRAVSTGKKGIEGAHPFVERTLTLAHNGTFSSYKLLDAYDTFEKDENPVDSHVVARELATRLDGNPLDMETLKAVLDDAGGSYAMLIMDAVDNALWVVRGNCSLNRTKIGPFNVINTSKKNLETISYMAERVSRYYTGERIERGEKAETIEYLSANKVGEGGELVKVGDIPSFRAITTYRSNRNTRQYATYYNRCGTLHGRQQPANDVGMDSTVAAEMADMFVESVGKVKGLTVWETKTIIEHTLGTPWYELSLDRLSAMTQALEELGDEYNTGKKQTLWMKILRQLVKQKKYADPYTALDDMDLVVDCPFFVATEATLESLLEEVEQRCQDSTQE